MVPGLLFGATVGNGQPMGCFRCPSAGARRRYWSRSVSIVWRSRTAFTSENRAARLSRASLGPAYNPQNNTLVVGEVDWCTSVRTVSKQDVQKVPIATAWTGASEGFGTQDDTSKWGGWVTATDVASGKRRWEFKAPYPVLGAVTPTAGRIVFTGDMGGNLYALDADEGAKLWSSNLGGAIAGGVISYDAGAGQRVAVAVGMTSPIWPTAKVTAKVVVLGLARQ